MTFFEEVTTTDEDGTPITKPGTVGVTCGARIQPLPSTEKDDRVTTRHSLILVRWKGDPLGARGAIEWNGKRNSIDEEPLEHNSSRQTTHIKYVMVRT